MVTTALVSCSLSQELPVAPSATASGLARVKTPPSQIGVHISFRIWTRC
jgi:hypothetical protein